jgi:hypothetical protein
LLQLQPTLDVEPAAPTELAGHAVQLLDPTLSAYVLAAHCVHEVEAAALKVPVGQMVSISAVGQLYPTKHSLHRVLLF